MVRDLFLLFFVEVILCSFWSARRFADLNLRSIMLSSIMVSNCPALHRINITSNSLQVCLTRRLLYIHFAFLHFSVYNSCNLFLDLQKLALQKQENLATLALQCQSLQEMDLTDCESLTNSICDVFSDGGGCPKLKSLVLDNCEVCEL